MAQICQPKAAKPDFYDGQTKIQGIRRYSSHSLSLQGILTVINTGVEPKFISTDFPEDSVQQSI